MKCLTLVILSLTWLTGCTKQNSAPLCRTAIKASVFAAQGVAAALDCKNVAEMAADFAAPIENLALCKDTVQTGVIGDVVCPAIAGYITQLGLSVAPEKWECKGGVALASAQKFLTTSCKSIIRY